MVFLTNIPKRGPSFDFYSRLTISSPLFGGDDGYSITDGYSPNAIVPFSTQGVVLLNEDTSSVVEVSFDGKTVHDRLDPAVARGFMYDNRVVSLIWLRLASGASAVVTIKAWGIR